MLTSDEGQCDSVGEAGLRSRQACDGALARAPLGADRGSADGRARSARATVAP